MSTPNILPGDRISDFGKGFSKHISMLNPDNITPKNHNMPIKGSKQTKSHNQLNQEQRNIHIATKINIKK